MTDPEALRPRRPTVSVRAEADREAESSDHPRSITPDEAFKAVGNPTRLTILDTLWGPGGSTPMAFAELRKAVGMRDGSQFNYHLRKLLDGGFVARDDGRYYIRQAGARVVCTVRTGYLTEHPELDPFETSGECFACGAGLAARYADEMFFVDCSACGRRHSWGWFPPTALDGRTPTEALLAHERVARTVTDLAVAGICSICNGPLERTLARTWDDVPVQSPVLDPDRESALRAWYVCRHCTAWVTVTPGQAVVDHPAVVALYHEHGVDLSTCPRWEHPWTVDESVLEVVSDDPFRVRVTIVFADEQRVLTLDEAFAVVAVE